MRQKPSARWIVAGAIGLGMLWTGQLAVVAADGQSATAHRLIIGWDDSVICCGPGTDAGMDSPQAVERMVKRWKARGIQGVYWRVDEAMLPERFMARWKAKVAADIEIARDWNPGSLKDNGKRAGTEKGFRK